MAKIFTWKSGRKTGTLFDIYEGNGSPEGVVTGNKGDLYIRLDGSSGQILYQKESGTGNTGWAPVLTAGATLSREQEYFTGNGTDDEFTCTSISFTSGTILDVIINGIEKFEGSGKDWTRDVDNQKIIFEFIPANNSIITVRKWS